MRRFMTAGTALALSLAFAAAAQADTNVQSLTGDWSANNSTVAKTADGVHFGTYANGGALGGSVLYKGANGLKLSDVNDFSYHLQLPPGREHDGCGSVCAHLPRHGRRRL